ncbi:MAG: helix-turn-helix transcriptional regulator [Methylococcaceae bacterium]
MSVNEKIKLVREAKGFTQEQVAEKLQMSKNGYGDIERGATDPKLSKLEKIAEAFNMELSELVDLTDKGTVNVNFSNQRNTKSHHQNHVYVGSQAAELKEQQLINDFQNKEITLLKRIIELMEVKTNVVNQE